MNVRWTILEFCFLWEVSGMRIQIYQNLSLLGCYIRSFHLYIFIKTNYM